MIKLCIMKSKLILLALLLASTSEAAMPSIVISAKGGASVGGIDVSTERKKTKAKSDSSKKHYSFVLDANIMMTFEKNNFFFGINGGYLHKFGQQNCEIAATSQDPAKAAEAAKNAFWDKVIGQDEEGWVTAFAEERKQSKNSYYYENLIAKTIADVEKVGEKRAEEVINFAHNIPLTVADHEAAQENLKIDMQFSLQKQEILEEITKLAPNESQYKERLIDEKTYSQFCPSIMEELSKKHQLDMAFVEKKYNAVLEGEMLTSETYKAYEEKNKEVSARYKAKFDEMREKNAQLMTQSGSTPNQEENIDESTQQRLQQLEGKLSELEQNAHDAKSEKGAEINKKIPSIILTLEFAHKTQALKQEIAEMAKAIAAYEKHRTVEKISVAAKNSSILYAGPVFGYNFSKKFCAGVSVNYVASSVTIKSESTLKEMGFADYDKVFHGVMPAVFASYAFANNVMAKISVGYAFVFDKDADKETGKPQLDVNYNNVLVASAGIAFKAL